MPGSDERAHRLATTVGLALLHAVLFTLAFPGAGLWPLAFVAPIPVAWLAIGAPSLRRALVVTGVVQVGMWLWLERWLIDVTAPGYPALALYMAIYDLLLVWLVRRVAYGTRTKRWPMALCLPVVWVGLECVQGEVIFGGYAWFLIGHPLVESPILVQSADLLGSYFVSFLAVAVAGAVVDGLRVRRWGFPVRAAAIAAIVVIAAHGANLVYGGWRLATTPAAPGPSVLAVQTNLPQSNKIAWTFEQQRLDMIEFITLTREAVEQARAAGRQVDLVVWPETMLPGFGLEPETVRYLESTGYAPGGVFANAVQALAGELGVPMLVGSPCRIGIGVSEDGRWTFDRHYNSAYLIAGPAPYPRYDKVFLTPFGEFMPYVSVWDWLEERLLALGAPGASFTLDAAESITRLRLPFADGAVWIATPICFEDTASSLCRRMADAGGVEPVGLFVNLSNDGWFGDQTDGRREHAQAARFRCIENRVPMIRCVNTGVSIAIDSAGRVTDRIGRGRYGTAQQAGWMWAETSLDGRRTVYGRLGEVWPWFCLVLTVVLAWLAGRRQSEGVP